MSITRMMNAAFRAADDSTYQNPSTWLAEALGAQKTASGERVTPEGAMNLSTYFRCLANLAEDMAKLPLMLYRRLEPAGKERAPDHPIYGMIHTEPNRRMSSVAFRETLQFHAASRGNGYAEIERDGMFRPVAMWPIHPSRVRVTFREGAPVYQVRVQDAGIGVVAVEIPQEDMFHIHGVGPDGYQGWSVARLAAESLGAGLAMQKFSGAFFGNGARVGGILSHPAQLSKEAQDRLRESWESKFGDSANAHKVAILEEGLTYTQNGIAPEEAQFIQTKEFSVEDICRWFRMPPSKVGHLKRAQGWSTLEMTNTDYVIDTLLSWAVRWQAEIGRKLLTEAERKTLFPEFMFLGLLVGDSEKRASFYRTMYELDALTPNEIREKENMNPLPDGDQTRSARAAAPAELPMATTTTTNESTAATITIPAAPSEAAPAPLLNAMRPVIDAAAERSRSRAHQRMENARKRLKDENKILEWKRTAREDQRKYMQDAFAPVALGLSIQPSIFDAAIDAFLDTYGIEPNAKLGLVRGVVECCAAALGE